MEKHNYQIKNLRVLATFFVALVFTISLNAATVTGSVSGDGDPLPGATVVVKGNSTVGTLTDIDGNFTLEVDLPATLVASYVGFSPQEIEVTEANRTNVRFSLSSGILVDQVIVTGTRAPNRTNLESPVPVDVIDISKLSAAAPQTSLNQILHFTTPSFSSNTQTISDGTDHVDPAALRGLGPDQVLVLIDGKRRHTTSLVNVNGTFGRGNVGTDLNALPAGAIKKIEVLRDGAAAQYGSDAIAGVINIKLKEDVNKLNLNVTTGANFTENIGPFDRETKSADGEVVNLSANYGIPLGDAGGFVNLTGEMGFRGATNRMQEFTGGIFNRLNAIERLAAEDGLDVSQLTLEQVQDYASQVSYFDQSVLDGLDTLNTIAEGSAILGADVTDQELNARDEERSDYNMRVGQSQVRNGNFFANMEFPVAENTKLYAFGGASYRNGESGCFYRLPSQERTTTSIYLNGTVPKINSNIIDRSVGAGITGAVGNWAVDISTVTGMNRFKFFMTDAHNATLGTASPTEFNSGGHQFGQSTSNFDMTRYFDNVGSFKGINVAFGAEYRYENFKVIPGTEQSWGNYDVNGNLVNATTPNDDLVKDLLGRTRPSGCQCFAGFLPTNEVDANRTNVGSYFDIEADISDALLIGAAIRFEEYADFGSTFNYKAVARYKANDNLAIRGAFSTGFRAPSLHQIHFSRTSTIFNIVDGESVAQEVGIFANTSRAARLLGIPELKQEESTNMSVGFTAKVPDANLRITVDAYQINIEDRVILTGQFDPTAVSDSLQQLEMLAIFDQAGATKAAFFANAIDTESQGIDIVIAHSIKVGEGTLTNDLAGTFSRTTWNDEIKQGDLDDDDGRVVFEGIKASQLLVDADLVGTYFDQTSRIYLEQAVPRVKVTLGNTYDIGKASIYLRNTYFGETTEATGEPIFNDDLDLLDGAGVDPYNDAKIVTDLSLGYKVSDDLTVTLGANNLLDVYPDESDPIFQSSGRFVYSRRSPQFSYGGRYLFARINFTLR